jgi:hypothetical protein
VDQSRTKSDFIDGCCARGVVLIEELPEDAPIQHSEELADPPIRPWPEVWD